MAQQVRFSEHAAAFAAERGATVRKCSMIGMRGVVTIVTAEGTQQMWDLGKLLFGKFTPEDPTLRAS